MNNLIFIVEDNLVQQKLLQIHFEEMLGNYVVRTFSNPQDLLVHLKDNPFAVILDHYFSDRMDKTGLDYLRQIKARYPSLAVIYYTTLNDENLRIQVMALGAEQYIVKNNASLVRLRTTLDLLHEKIAKKKAGFFQRFLS